MAVPSNLNIINCAAGDVLGTGLAGCRTDMKRIVALFLIERGYKFEADITKASIQTLQQQGKVIWLSGVVTLTDSTPDNSIDTAPGSGIKTLLTEFPYEYMVTFNNGINFQKALTALSGYANYDLGLMDVDDQVWLTQNKAADVKGYALGMHQKGKYVGANGEARAQQSLFLQLTDRNEVDARACWVKPDDFSATDMDGVNDVTITIDPVEDGDTTIVFTPTLIDGSHLVEGLLIANLALKSNGTPVVPSAISYVTNPGKVTLTVSARTAAQVLTLETYDSGAASNIIKQSTGVLLKSNTATATVQA